MYEVLLSEVILLYDRQSRLHGYAVVSNMGRGGQPKERCPNCKGAPILVTLGARVPKEGYKSAPRSAVGKMCRSCPYVKIGDRHYLKYEIRSD